MTKSACSKISRQNVNNLECIGNPTWHEHSAAHSRSFKSSNLLAIVKIRTPNRPKIFSKHFSRPTCNSRPCDKFIQDLWCIFLAPVSKEGWSASSSGFYSVYHHDYIVDGITGTTQYFYSEQSEPYRWIQVDMGAHIQVVAVQSLTESTKVEHISFFKLKEWAVLNGGIRM